MPRSPGDERELQTRRDFWRYRGKDRPAFAIPPKAGEESVWDYPRPPRLVDEPRRVEVGGLARSRNARKVQETASPPTVYLPPEDVDLEQLQVVPGETLCEWKGQAEYLALATSDETDVIAWRYPEPFSPYEALAGWLSFYPGRVVCTLGGERVVPQPGGFYAGWLTPELVGPFKGEPGSEDW